jgi:hypothetical protein
MSYTNVSIPDPVTNTSEDSCNDYDETIQSVFDLMYHRIHGTSTASVTNEQIENTVQNIMQQKSPVASLR